MRRRLCTFSTLIVAATLVAGCGSSDDSPDGAWILVEGTYDGFEIVPPAGAEMSLNIDGDQVSGQMACNQYGGSAEISDGSISTNDLALTRMACQPQLMELEQVGLAALNRSTDYSFEDGELWLRGDGVELRFVPSRAEPAED